MYGHIYLGSCLHHSITIQDARHNYIPHCKPASSCLPIFHTTVPRSYLPRKRVFT
ncbi:hypothetical protein AG1IA_10054 [Rhizoctonia solani AG-1 IA]|uniref:Uncharacterized protein n=1 Tax=Thanatephorus cucumeris (strain AG1-IA) TaxID=983506 RepID=L8WCM1_THACA|nr:hypothetical protein AG1IA_10054 [Rhizoctonia solani AG-1 IA]